MADFTVREVLQTTRQYVLLNPTNLGDVSKVVDFIERSVTPSEPVKVPHEVEITFSFVLLETAVKQ